MILLMKDTRAFRDMKSVIIFYNSNKFFTMLKIFWSSKVIFNLEFEFCGCFSIKFSQLEFLVLMTVFHHDYDYYLTIY